MVKDSARKVNYGRAVVPSSLMRLVPRRCSRAALIMEAGEYAAEACIREVWEETGLSVRVKRLVGVYSNPNQLVVYPDGNKVHIVVMSFEVEVIGGELGLSNETTEAG